MKKIRFMLLGAVILLASVSAIATKPAYDCSYATQYVFNGTSYIEAGQFGYDFICLSYPGICTYYKPDPVFQPNNYQPCHPGRFVPAWGTRH
ncbi:MAG: hypothetical protein JST39_25410 [Bacteroidetes bacterium]|nr:hypothetical protein [Bacteroidota bacterium]